MGVIKNAVIVKKKKKRTAVITLTPDERVKMDFKSSGDFTNVEIFDMINALQSHYAKMTVEDYTRETGDKSDDDKKFDAWLTKKRK